MQITRKDNSTTSISLTIQEGAERLIPIKDKVLRKFRSSVKLAGFREGKAPLSVVEKNVDQSLLQTEFLETAVQQLYVEAVQQENLRPVSPPDVQIKKFVPFTELEFEMDITIVGDITLPDYKKTKQKRESVKVTDEDIDEVIKSLKIRMSEKQDVERPSKEGDQVWIDFKGVDAKGEPVKGAEGKDYPIVLGSDTFIPGFEQNVIGMGADEEKTFTLTFPKDYRVSALAGQKVTFTVTVTKVQEVIEPVIDDDFAAKAGPFKTVQELKADIRRQLEEEKSYEAARKYEASIVKEISDASTVPLPEILVTEQIGSMREEIRRNLAYKGMTWQEFLEAEGHDEKSYDEEVLRPQAAERLKASLVLSEIAERERLSVSPEELELRIQALKSQYKDSSMQEELDKPASRRDIASRMLTEKTISALLSYLEK